MKTKVQEKKQAEKIIKRLEAQLSEITECFEEFVIKTCDCDTFFTTIIHSKKHWIMTSVVLKRISKVAERFCKRYDNMHWGIECGEYTSGTTGKKYHTPQIYIQLSLSK